MKHIAQILSFSLALILAITFTTPVFADTNPPEDTAHAYHFRTAKEYDAPRYVLNRCGKQLAISVKSGM